MELGIIGRESAEPEVKRLSQLGAACVASSMNLIGRDAGSARPLLIQLDSCRSLGRRKSSRL